MLTKKNLQNYSLRTLFIIKYFETLKKHEVKFAVIRGHKKIFLENNKDIDILMNPSDYETSISIYRDLLHDFKSVFISSITSNKNLYLKSLFINKMKESTEIEGLYIHITAYVTIKNSYKRRNSKFRGLKVWVDSFEIIEEIEQGILLPIPEPKVQLLFALTKYTHKLKKRYIDDMQEIIANYSLQNWLKEVDNTSFLLRFFDEKEKIPQVNLYQLINNMAMLCRLDKPIHRLSQYIILIRLIFKQAFFLKGRLIFFSGPDGSGKTTANEALTQILTEKLKISVINSKHLYPLSNKTSTKAQKLQSKIRKINIKEKDALERDRGRGLMWKLRRLTGLIYILLQVWPGYLYARYKNLMGYTVIIDTSFFDAFVKGHRPDFPIIKRITVPMIPCGDHWFLMSASPQEIVARKPELTVEEITNYYVKLENISKISWCKPDVIATNTGVSHALKKMVVSLNEDD